MKIAGAKLTEPYVETLVFPRGQGREPLVLKVKAVLDYGTFEQLVPMPKIPTRLVAGATEPTLNPEDPKYKSSVGERFWKRHCWMLIQSLSATPDLEWERVKFDDPSTWDSYTQELGESGFTPFEIIRIEDAVKSVNGLNDAKIRQAEKDFLSKTGRDKESHSQALPSLLGALRTSQSGEPAKEPG